MNERIKELAFQAMSINQKVSDDAFFVEVSKLKEFEKFAELIVRECAELMYGRDENGNCKDGDVIKKHFGVEE